MYSTSAICSYLKQNGLHRDADSGIFFLLRVASSFANDEAYWIISTLQLHITPWERNGDERETFSSPAERIFNTYMITYVCCVLFYEMCNLLLNISQWLYISIPLRTCVGRYVLRSVTHDFSCHLRCVSLNYQFISILNNISEKLRGIKEIRGMLHEL